ncbi:MAG: hypothetical protein ACQGVC_26390 [Myxococcota bacterium]
METRLVLIEGLPGTGKTTTAGSLARRLSEAGWPGAWWREEEADHPATPRSLRRTAARPGFAERCLASWERFVDARRPGEPLPILEGAALQSTIRFLLEHAADEAEILDFVRALDRVLAPLAPLFVHLRARDPRRHLTGFVYPLRGEAWVGKVGGHLERTPFCRERGWRGVEGMTRFWLRYAALCDAALRELSMPVLQIEVSDTGRVALPEREERVFSRLASAP